MANKKTNKDFFAEVIALAGENAELAAWAQKQIEALNKKAENRKPTKTQEANVGLKAKILEIMAAVGKPMTVTEILQAGDFGSEISNQKLSALLKQMVETDKTAVKTVDKKKSYFAAAAADEEEGE